MPTVSSAVEAISRIEYPDQPVWDLLVPQEERLVVVNPNDFVGLGRHLETVGINTSHTLRSALGITNRAELEQRLQLSSLLLGNPALRGWIHQIELPTEIPNDQDAFMRQLVRDERGHNAYWGEVHRLVSELSKYQLPARLQADLAALRQSLPLEEHENATVDTVVEQLEQMTVVEGVAQVRLSTSDAWVNWEAMGVADRKPNERMMQFVHGYATGTGHGHRLYSSALPTEVTYPKWCQNSMNPLNWIGVGALAKLLAEKRFDDAVKAAYRQMVLDEIPDTLTDDLVDGVRTILNKLALSDYLPLGPGVDDPEWPEEIVVNVFYRYGANYEDSLVVRILSVDVDPGIDQTVGSVPSVSGFSGYSDERLEQIKQAHEETRQLIYNARRAVMANALMAAMMQADKGLFEREHVVQAPRTDYVHRWFAISNLLKRDDLAPVVAEMRRHRAFVERVVSRLKLVTGVVNSHVHLARKYKADVCVPQLLSDNEHLISADGMLPVHLGDGSYSGLVPIDLPPVNSQLIMLTGSHGGGKTTTLEQLFIDLYMAHSGLPLLCRSFSFNLKALVAGVFIERGKGSTAETLLRKFKEALEKSAKYPAGAVLMLFDEIGAGTQEHAGLELGQDLLATLHARGCSGVLSSQITALAERARDQYGAMCLNVQPDHRFTEGIGDGGMSRLRQRVGLDDFLVRSGK